MCVVVPAAYGFSRGLPDGGGAELKRYEGKQ